jgi:hypothetical protein
MWDSSMGVSPVALPSHACDGIQAIDAPMVALMVSLKARGGVTPGRETLRSHANRNSRDPKQVMGASFPVDISESLPLTFSVHSECCPGAVLCVDAFFRPDALKNGGGGMGLHLPVYTASDGNDDAFMLMVAVIDQCFVLFLRGWVERRFGWPVLHPTSAPAALPHSQACCWLCSWVEWTWGVGTPPCVYLVAGSVHRRWI